MLNVRNGAGYITQRLDVGGTLRQRADDHRRIAEECQDPRARQRLEQEAKELEADHRRFAARRFM